VKFYSTPTSAINSTPILIYGAPVTSIVDSIIACNTCDQDIFVDVTLLTAGRDEVTNTYIQKRFLIPQNSSADLAAFLMNSNASNPTSANSTLILQNGDILYANSDLSGNTFDTLLSGRQLLETA